MKQAIIIFILALALVGCKNENKDHVHSTIEEDQMWTCSMHPQIMQAEPGDCPICGMDLIPAASGSEGLAPDQFKLTENAMALANIQTSVVGAELSSDGNIRLSGKIVENEEANSVQVSHFAGRIERLNISSTGENVNRGQLLASVYSPELVTAQQELLTASSLKDRQPGLYRAVYNKLKLWKLSDSQIQQIEASGTIREDFPVYATTSGVVTEKLVEEGDYIKQGQPLFKVTNLGTVWAVFDVYEQQIGELKVNQPIKITTNAYGGKEIEGSISFIDPVMNTRTRTVQIRVVLNNKEGLLKPGMFVSGAAIGEAQSEGKQISIPASAVLWTGRRSLVYVKTSIDEPVFEMREVVLGPKTGESYEVTSGLENGDVIVTNGTFTVDAAAQLKGKKSMMNKQGDMLKTGHEGHLGSTQDSDGSSGSHSDHKELKFEVSDDFQIQLQGVVDAYLILKDELVAGDATSAGKAGSDILEKLAAVDMKLLDKRQAHDHWMFLLNEIKASSGKIAESRDIGDQRKHFKNLSRHLIGAVSAFGINKKVYNQFCPMADNDRGGNWLSLTEEVRNPYFGNAMLQCGSVVETFED